MRPPQHCSTTVHVFFDSRRAATSLVKDKEASCILRIVCESERGRRHCRKQIIYSTQSEGGTLKIIFYSTVSKGTIVALRHFLDLINISSLKPNAEWNGLMRLTFLLAMQIHSRLTCIQDWIDVTFQNSLGTGMTYTNCRLLHPARVDIYRKASREVFLQ